MVKILKALFDGTLIYNNPAPDWEQLEAVRANRLRILEVIKARWAAIGLMIAYGAYLAVFYGADPEVSLTRSQAGICGGALLIVIAYNSWFHRTYRRWARVRWANDLQLLADLLVITVLVHFSGGVHSWFWAMYILVTLEATFLLEKPSEVWLVGAVGALAYGALLTAEYYNIIFPVAMPFEDPKLQHTLTYEMITWGWVAVMNAAVAFIGTHLMGIVRERESVLRRLVVRDPLTELYNRRYFFHRLNGELERCKRFGRQFSLLIIDVDDFKKFNDAYGHVEGDELLTQLSRVLAANVRRSDTTPTYEVDIACRYGGEEFAIILPETDREIGLSVAERLRQQISTDTAVKVAERIRDTVEETDMAGKRVTVSIGIATFPSHGTDPDTLVRAADAAMYKAKAAGKNRVALAPGQDVQGLE